MDNQKTHKVALKIPFNGRTVRATPLTPGQIVAITTQRKTSTDVQRINLIFRVLENSVGTEEWDRMTDDLVEGISISDFADFANLLIEGTSQYHANQNKDPESLDG